MNKKRHALLHPSASFSIKLPVFFCFLISTFLFGLPAASETSDDRQEASAHPQLIYYGEISCAHCDLFAEKILPAAETAAGVAASAEYRDILSAEGYEQCVQDLEKRGYEFSVFPVMIIGNNVYQGNSAIEKNLPEELNYYEEYGSYRPELEERAASAAGFTDSITDSNQEKKNLAVPELAFFPVFAAGLIDGINPCAFSVMLFFISWITLRGGGRRRILLTGTAFIAGIFISYSAIGYGLLTFFRTASGFETVRQILRYLFTILSLVFAALSFLDAVRLQRGNKTNQLFLQLPKSIKRSVHKIIRTQPAQASGRFTIGLFLSFALTGLIVSLLELACTGQIYFPAIAYMVQSGSSAKAHIFWLLLYNTAFILPLLTILLLAAAGIEQQQIRGWFSRHLVMSKLLIAVLFLSLAALIWFT